VSSRPHPLTSIAAATTNAATRTFPRAIAVPPDRHAAWAGRLEHPYLCA
jgi:hypothetical protein